MAYWSNNQANWIGRGSQWKNLWITNYKWLRVKYFIHDYVVHWYFRTRAAEDNQLRKSYEYHYDFVLYKTYNKILYVLKMYNLEFSWISYILHFSRLQFLKNALWRWYQNDFLTLTAKSKNIFWMITNPFSYFYLWLVNPLSHSSINTLALTTCWLGVVDEDQSAILGALSNSFFLLQSALSSQVGIFDKNLFDEVDNFNYTFINRHISMLTSTNLPHSAILMDKFWLANFFFNPMFLRKYSNFIFYYNTWLHKSWQLAKRESAKSLLFQSNWYVITQVAVENLKYFFARLLWFFSVMRELNSVSNWNKTLGIGITRANIDDQIWLLRIWLRFWTLIFNKIKEIWFYLKAYNRYFAFEAKVNFYHPQAVLKKFYSLKWLLYSISKGLHLTVGTLISFLQHFSYIIVPTTIVLTAIQFLFSNDSILTRCYLVLSKVFLKAIWLLKKVLWLWKVTLFQKIWFIHNLSIFLIFGPKPQLLLENFGYIKIIDKNLFQSQGFWLSIITLITILFFFYNPVVLKKSTKIYELQLIRHPRLLTHQKCIIDTNKLKIIKQKIVLYKDFKERLWFSDWFTIICFQPTLINKFIQYMYSWEMLWRKKFHYFYFSLSNLTLKTFFRIITDLNMLFNFSLLLHLTIIYWQHFFFYYFFVLHCLKQVYAQASIENLLYLAKPWVVFAQRSRSYNTILDLFSTTLQGFDVLGWRFITSKHFMHSKLPSFTLADIASSLAGFGKPNKWWLSTGNKFVYLSKFSNEQFSDSFIFIPFFSIWSIAKSFFFWQGEYNYEKKNRLNVSIPFYTQRIPLHFIIDYFTNLNLNSTLLATFVWKKLEQDHSLSEIIRNLGLLVARSENIKGFIFFLKGRFSRWEWAGKVWFKKGKLEQVKPWTKVDYCIMPVTMKYGVASIWIWMVLTTDINDWQAVL